MRTFEQFLNEYMEAVGVPTDYQLAKHLAVSPQYIYKIRHLGRATDEFCLEIAEKLGIDAGPVMIARNAVRETGRVGDAWRKMLERVAVVLLLCVGFEPAKSEGIDLQKATQVIDSTNKDYRKLRIRFFFQALARFLASLFPVTSVTSTTAQNAF